MKKAWVSLGLAAGMLALSNSASAWVALAATDSGYSYYYSGAQSKAIASEQALQRCNETASEPCKLQVAAHRAALVFASGSDGNSGTATRADPSEARAVALEECAKVSKNCLVLNAAWDNGKSWTALATGEGAYHLALNQSSPEEARRAAVEGCEKNAKSKCKVNEDFLTAGPGYIVAARNATNTGLVIRATKSDAIKAAIEQCETDSRNQGSTEVGKCKVSKDDIDVLEPPAPEPAGMKAIYAEVKQNKAALSKKPAITPTSSRTVSTNRTSCTNRCTNGACLRTFPDGRQERWQAPRAFDPIQNNWGWDTTTNACGL